MKILHVIPTYKPAWVYGGPIHSISTLCEHLAAAGHQVRMLTTTANGPGELPVTPGELQLVDGVEVQYFRRYTGDHTHLSPGLVAAVWRQCRRFDVVHIHSWWNIPVMLSVLVCLLRGVRPIVSPRGMLSDFSFGKSNPLSKRLLHALLGKHLLQRVWLHCTSEAERMEAERLGFTQASVLPNFIELAPTAGPPLPRNTPPVLLFLSRIHEKKNLESLLDVLGDMPWPFRLQIAGEGEAEYVAELKNRIAALGLTDRVAWLGYLSGAEKYRCYANADLFVLPSFNENFANAVLEALSAGTPVLVSDRVGLADFVEQHDLGWVCQPAPQELRAALEAFFSNPELARQKGLRAAAIVPRHFSPKTMTERYLDLYRAHAQL